MKKGIFKKFLTLALVVAVTATATVAGTVAYLTKDVGTKTNTFTVGDLNITLEETVGVESNGGGLGTPTENGGEYTNLMPGDKIIKEVTLTNNDDPAYVRVTVTLKNKENDFANVLNKAIDGVYETKGLPEEALQAMYDYIFDGWGLNYTKVDAENNPLGMRLTITGDDMPAINGNGIMYQVDSVKTIDEYAQFYTGNWFGEQTDIIPFDGYYTKDMNKYELRYTYYMLLEEGASTTLFNGFNIPEEFNADQLAMFNGLEIVIDADAIQAANIAGEYKSVEQAKLAFQYLNGDVEMPSLYSVAKTEDDLFKCLSKDGVCIVKEPIANTEPADIPENVTVTLDINEKQVGYLRNSGTAAIENGTISNSGAGLENFGVAEVSDVTMNAGSPADYSNITRGANAKTTYNDVTINSSGGGIGVVDGGEVVFNSGSIDVNTKSTSGRYLFYLEGNGSTLTINGGNFDFNRTQNQKRAYIYAGEGTTVYVKGGTFGKASTRSGYTAGILGTGTVIITGGTFGFDPSTWVAEGYKAVKEGSTWTVVSKSYVSTNEELDEAIKSGIIDLKLSSGTYQMPASAKSKTLTITGAGPDTVIEVIPGGQSEANGQLDYNLDGSKVTFNNLTIKTNSQLYAGYARLSATYNNCVIQNTYNLGTGNSVFNNCTFNTDGRALLVFQDGTNVAQTVTVKDCTFNATAAANTWNGIHVAAVSCDGSQGGTYVVNFEGTNTVDSDFNGLWQIKDGEENVTINE